MIETYRKLFDLLEPRERWRFVVLMGVLVVAALADLVGLSAVLGLLNVLSDPARLPGLPVIGPVLSRIAGGDIFAGQIMLTLAVIGVIVAALVLRALAAYAMIRFAEMRGYSIACRLLGAYLRQPYIWFLNRNTADISKSVLSETSQLVGRVLTPALRMLANAFVVIVILAFLTTLDPLIAPVAGGVIGGGYVLIYLRLRPRLLDLGRRMLAANSARFRIAQEATAGIKEVKLLGLEEAYVRRFEAAARRLARASALNNAFSELPRFALEALTFAAMMGLILLLLLRNDGNLVAIIPLLGTTAFATLRLLPALQQIYHAFASLRTGQAVLNHIHADYTAARAVPAIPAGAQPLPFERELAFDAVAFSYPAAARPALNGVSLTIPARATVGIVGSTGAGKTTLVDLVLGLLAPDSGEIRVDGVAINAATRRAWQRSVGYVPQAIYLTDDTVAANIAFGVPPETIDPAAVERAARIAALHDFVLQDLPQGYQTIVGERGVRLSGGQRQRIGIARALYRDPLLLVMDEATSALDNLTERAVMEAVANMRGNRTIILIAHRLSTVRNCDMIFLMEKGRLAAAGTYDELVEANETFRRMATAG